VADKELRARLSVSGENAAKAGLKNFGDAAGKAGEQVEGLAEDSGFLGKQVEETQAKVEGLIEQLDKTGDTSLLKEIRKGKRELRLFEGLKKELDEQQASLRALEESAASAQAGLGHLCKGGDKLAKKNIIHWKKAANQKSKLAKLANKLA
jgi:small subunit ribosomal protein S20